MVRTRTQGTGPWIYYLSIRIPYTRVQESPPGGHWGECGHLAADHDVCDFGFAVAAVCLVVPRPDRQHEVPGVTLALPHQEAAVLPFLRQQLLGLAARQVSVEPPVRERHRPNSFIQHEGGCAELQDCTDKCNWFELNQNQRLNRRTSKQSTKQRVTSP